MKTKIIFLVVVVLLLISCAVTIKPCHEEGTIVVRNLNNMPEQEFRAFVERYIGEQKLKEPEVRYFWRDLAKKDFYMEIYTNGEYSGWIQDRRPNLKDDLKLEEAYIYYLLH